MKRLIFKLSTPYFFKIFLFFAFFSSFSLLQAAKPLRVAVKADAAILINADTGAILFEKNSDKPLDPASITKIATALYTLKVQGHKLDTLITAEQDCIGWTSEEAKKRSNYTLPAYWLTPGGTHISIQKGEELPLEALLYGMMLPSGNDAANVTAQYVGGTVPQFMKMVNEYLKEIGCKNTHFANPHGLYHPDHRTTAYDMAVMAREAMKDPMFRKIVSTVRYKLPKTNKREPTTIVQGNALLRRGKHFYDKAIGIKTGYNSQAKNTLVAAAMQGDRTLIAVVMKDETRSDAFRDVVKLFEAAFAQPKIRKTYLKEGNQRMALKVKGADNPIKSYTQKEIALDYYPGEEPEVKCFLSWDPVELPVQRGQKIGEIALKNGEGAVLQRANLYAREDVDQGWLQDVKSFFKGSNEGGSSLAVKIIVGLGLLLLFGWFASHLRR